MKTANFEFLKSNKPELYLLAQAAEASVYDSPIDCALYIRTFVENLLNLLIPSLHIEIQSLDANQIIDNPILCQCIKHLDIQNTFLNIIRITDFAQVKPEFIQKNVLSLLKALHLLAIWYDTIDRVSSLTTTTSETASENLHFTPPLLAVGAFSQLGISQASHLLHIQKQLRSSIVQVVSFSPLDKTSINHARTAFNRNAVLAMEYLQGYELPSFDFSGLTLSDYFTAISLTPSQTKLIAKLEIFFADPTQHAFIIKGYAGTGKTFITRTLTHYLSDQKINLSLAAPTCKAVDVLEEKSGKSAYTIHGLIYEMAKQPDIDFTKSGESLRIRKKFDLKQNVHDGNHVYIFDEASMIGNSQNGNQEFIEYGSGYILNDLMEFIDPHFDNAQRKIIFIGDPAQLPPVGSNHSPALSKSELALLFNLNVMEFEMTDVVRQNGESGILNNASHLRTEIFSAAPMPFKIHNQYEDLRVLSNVLSQTEIDNYFNHLKMGKTNAVLLAYANSTVNKYNRLIHEQLFPNAESICVHDKIMAYESNQSLNINNGAIGIVKELAQTNEERTVFLFNVATRRREKVVLKFRDATILFPKGKKVHLKLLMNYFELNNINNENENSKLRRALHIEFFERFKKEYRGNERTKERFYQQMNSDLYFNAFLGRLGYAMTIHKAQGSEWDNVFIDFNFQGNRHQTQILRALYTGITRAKKQISFLNMHDTHLTHTEYYSYRLQELAR